MRPICENRTITVDGVAMAASDGSGQFRIERSGFSAPADCTVDVNDGSATATPARLSGCTVSSPPSAPSLAALGLSASTVVGGTPVTGTVTLTSAAPAGIDCTFTTTGAIGTCGNVFLPAGTQVRLDARPANGSQFLGWEFETTCRDAPNVTVVAGVAHICRPVFRLR